MYKVSLIEHSEEPPLDLFARYMIGPFLAGQGHMLGSILRHVMLSELTGFAIIGARIKGVDHEFSSISNMREDITDLLLNLKEIVFKTNEQLDDTKGFILGTIKYNEGNGFITSNNIILPPGITVVDSHQYIAEITGKGEFELDLLISRGIGYALSTSFEDFLPQHFLGVDAIFMPIINASFLIETTENSLSGVESLIFDVRTNGSLLPDEAITCAAEIVIRSFERLLLAEIPEIVSLEEAFSSEKDLDQLRFNWELETSRLSERNNEKISNHLFDEEETGDDETTSLGSIFDLKFVKVCLLEYLLH
jgi:DNA-directed RNA polymerase subunit alpha